MAFGRLSESRGGAPEGERAALSALPHPKTDAATGWIAPFGALPPFRICRGGFFRTGVWTGVFVAAKSLPAQTRREDGSALSPSKRERAEKGAKLARRAAWRERLARSPVAVAGERTCVTSAHTLQRRYCIESRPPSIALRMVDLPRRRGGAGTARHRSRMRSMSTLSWPPSISIIVPLTKKARSEAR